MARPLARFRHQHVTREERRMLNWTKPLLVAALRDMPTICPPRTAQQSKKELERIVRGALERDDNDPIRLKMQRALADARAQLFHSN